MGDRHVSKSPVRVKSGTIVGMNDDSADTPDNTRDVLEAAAGWIAAAERVTVLTGAGISTDSGIPDFRGPNGLWTKNPAAEKMATIQHYLADPEIRKVAWQNRLAIAGVDGRAERRPPGDRRARTAGQAARRHHPEHRRAASRAGNDPDKVIEVHGTMWWTRCWECGDRRPMAETLDRVRAGEEDPPCLVCGGILKSDTISFGQALVPEVIDRAMQVSGECDVLLAVGSTLAVYPVANCVPLAKSAGAKVVIVNAPSETDASDAHRRRPVSRRRSASAPAALRSHMIPNPDTVGFSMATFRDLLSAAKA